MGFQVSAGVKINEIDLTNVIPAVSTTEGAIVIHSTWGPVLKRVLVDSEATLARQFGNPNANTYNDFFPAASFLDYGNKLYVVRVVNANNTGTSGSAVGRNAITTAANSKNTVIKNDDDYNNNYTAGITSVGSWVAKYPGSIGSSLRVSVCPSANAWQSTLTGTVDFTNNSTVITGTSTQFTNQLTVGDILLAGTDKREVKVAAITNTTYATLQTAYVGNTISTQASVTRRWEFYNNFDAAPGSSSYALRVGGSNDEMHIVVADEDGLFTNIANNVLERFSKVSKATDARTDDGTGNYYVNVINTQSQYMWWAANLTGITNIAKAAQGVNFGVGTQSRPINASFVNGRDGAKPQESQYTTGYNLFSSAEDVDISIVLLGETTQTRALNVINNIAEKRKDCIAVLSPRRTDIVNNGNYVNKEMDDTITFRNLLPSSSYACLDSGYKYMYDKYNDLYRYVATNGDVAGLMVRTDDQFDPWYSPAGFNRGQIKNVIKLAFNPSRTARDQLYKNGINPIVTFPGQGTVLFGDKTLLAKPSAFDRINVRRLFIVLEKAITVAARFSLFEFNDDFTRAQFRNLVEPFLRDVQGRRGIYDFRVVCDRTNNTPEVIDRNEFVGSIFIKPARSINFITLNFVAVRTGVEFSEITDSFG